MLAGVGGRGFMYADGVLGGSILGFIFFQDSTNLVSSAVSTGRSVENWRRHLMDVAEALLKRDREPCRSILGERRLFQLSISFEREREETDKIGFAI